MTPLPESTPAANRRRGVGCLVAFVGMVLLTLVPAIGNYISVDPRVAYLLLALAVLLLFIGAAVSIGAERLD